MKRKLMLLLACLFVGIGLVTAQTQKVTGVVISEEDGQPVVGASVLVKGTTLGTITDVDGNFNLSNVPSSAKTLQISYIGMQTQEVVIKPTLKVVLKSDSQNLDEVVVTAMGIKRSEKSLGYAVSSVKGDEITKARESNVLNSLSGKIAGLQIAQSSGTVGGSSSIQIRGASSIGSVSSPLFIIDGLPIDNGSYNPDRTNGIVDVGNRAGDINSDDIESINVLKGAAAHYIAPNDKQALMYLNAEAMFSMVDNLFTGINILVWMVGLGTLLAGAIGVSNIMMVTVKERTTEIGIRRAIGARPKDILQQILSESMVLTTIAGMCGISFAVMVLQLVEMGANADGGDVRFQVTFGLAIGTCALLIALGMLAGLAPAYRAMAIKPIEAIRDE